MMKRLRPPGTHPAFFTGLVFWLVTLASPSPGIGQQPAPASDPAPITLTVSVLDKNERYFSDLKKENFSVYDQKAPQEIVSFDNGDAPASVAILFDVSPSMLNRPDAFTLLRTGVLRFIQQGDAANDYLIVSFADDVRVLADWGSSDESLVRALNGLAAASSKGEVTALQDACYLAVEKLKGSHHPRRVILLVTDGMDYGSRRGTSELHRALKESDAIVYSVALIKGGLGSTDFSLQVYNKLKRLADISGGRAFIAGTAAAADEIFERIRLEIQHQYSLSFRPATAAGGGKWHPIEVKVTRLSNGPRLPGLTVRAREGYYAK
jgi:Ca-activated chloride channel family protein